MKDQEGGRQMGRETGLLRLLDLRLGGTRVPRAWPQKLGVSLSLQCLIPGTLQGLGKGSALEPFGWGIVR